MRNHTLAPLAALALAIRNVAARMMADRDPSGYDNATAGLAPDAGEGLDTAPDAYTACGPDGFGMFGAYGDPRLSPTCDELTGADGFLPDGDLPGVGADRYQAAQWAAREQVQSERVTSLMGQWGLTERKALEYLGADAGPDVDTAGACWSTSEGLADTTELSDDGDRYAHLADSYLAERRATEQAEQRNVRGPDGQLTHLAEMRLARFGRLYAYIRSNAKASRSKVPSIRQAGTYKLAAARKGIAARYKASVAMVQRSKGSAAPAAGIYLTQAQAQILGAIPAKRDVWVSKALVNGKWVHTFRPMTAMECLGQNLTLAANLAAIGAQTRK